MNVVIRNVGNEWQIATVACGLYNCIVSSGTYQGAVRYCEEKSLKWGMYKV